MFELSLTKQSLLPPLLTVAGAVDKKQSLAILSNILITLGDQQLRLTATDLEIEMTARIVCQSGQGQGAVTVPAKKFIDIIRSLDEDACPTIVFDKGGVLIKQGRSQFKLATLPANDYPNTQDEVNEIEFVIGVKALTHLLQSTQFALSQQDVRVFLNCLLIEMDERGITSVATDGHRMAVCRHVGQLPIQHHRILLPRKGVQEILRVLNAISDEQVTFSAGKNHIKIISNDYTFSSKLVDARFPPYAKAIPKEQDKVVIVDRDALRRALTRIIILASEKYKAVVLHIESQQLTLIANNQEQEEGIESLEVMTEGEPLKIGINASYLLDVLAHVSEGLVRLSFFDTDSSILVESEQDKHYQYIIMPMKL
jgi:DNA polymerase-3 subunit beta